MRHFAADDRDPDWKSACFSASARFVAGTSLSAIGVAALKKTETNSERPFAMIPLLFGIQQLIVGAIWLTFAHDAPVLKQTMSYLYSGFSNLLAGAGRLTPRRAGQPTHGAATAFTLHKISECRIDALISSGDVSMQSSARYLRNADSGRDATSGGSLQMKVAKLDCQTPTAGADVQRRQLSPAPQRR